MFVCFRSSWFSPSFSSDQLAMRTTSSLRGLRGSAGWSLWAPSSGSLWVPSTPCGCSRAPPCRWCTTGIRLSLNVCTRLRCLSPAETKAVHHSVRPGWAIQNALLWEGGDRWTSRGNHKFKHEVNRETHWEIHWDKLLTLQCHLVQFNCESNRPQILHKFNKSLLQKWGETDVCNV